MPHILHAATGPARSWGLQNGRGLIETSCIWAGGAYSAPQTSWCQSNYSSEALGEKGLSTKRLPSIQLRGAVCANKARPHSCLVQIFTPP